MFKYKKQILMIIIITLMQASTVYAANYSISGALSGPLKDATLTVTVQPDIMLPVGTSLSLFVVANLNNYWYYMQPSGMWIPWTLQTQWSDIVSYQTTTTATPPMPTTITPIYDANLSTLTGSVIYVGYAGPNFSPTVAQPVAAIPNATINEPVSYPTSFAPSNWPNHIAMGAAMDTMSDIPYYANIEAINKYATGDGAPGQIVAPHVINSLIDDAYELTNLQMSHTGNYYSVRPVLVEYTANGSQSLEILRADFTLNNMAMHFINLMKDCNAIGAQSSTNTSIILNPDLLGEIEQLLFTNASAANQTNPNFIANVINSANANINVTNLLSGCSGTCSLPVKEALKIAVYFINNYPNSTSQSDFSIAVANYMSVTKASVNNNMKSVDIPTVTNDFAGYIQTINWIVRNYAPKANFGWHSNIRTSYDIPWPGVYDGLWTHTIPSSSKINSYASVISTFWTNLGVYTGSNKPDFIVFDKYGVNGFSSYVSTFSNGYLFNQQDMNSYLAFVKAITTSLGVPAMLWQIPGGHIGADEINSATMSTEAQFFFGDSDFSTYNIPTGSLSSYYRSYQKYNTAQFLNNTCGSDGSSACDWSKSNLNTAENSNVFAILWGTGTRSTSIGTYPGGDQLDGGWLLGKVNAYYNAPNFTPGAVTPTNLSPTLNH
jgi:hypothetical protein